MQPFEAYKLYVALKQHFTTSYDFHKYGGKIKATEASFENRNDKPFFFKLSKHTDPQGLLVSTHVRHGDLWIGDIVHGEEVAQSYAHWKKVQGSFVYTFKQDMNELRESYNPVSQILRVPKGQHPLLLQRVLSRKTNIETMIALNEVIRFTPDWCKLINDPVIWPAIHFKCVKYKPFLKFSRDELEGFIIDNIDAGLLLS